jgi:outer membrane protein OmpA-like peptidoglycan-associated protein
MPSRRTLIVAATMATFGVTGTAAPLAAQQPQFTTIRAEFLPGERTIFFDDFTDMIAGDAPSHFRVRGAPPELSVSGSLRQLTYTRNGVLTPNLTALPANFTFESEVKFDVPRGTARFYLALFSQNREAATWHIWAQTNGSGTWFAMRVPRYEELGRTAIPMDLSQPAKIALWVQDGRVRAYVNGERYLDVNQVQLPPIDRVELRTDLGAAGVAVAWRWVRFAESAPDFSSVIGASGRYVSHGIQFDTDSDQLRPESGPALKIVARGLASNPALRLLIEGHTDAVGDVSHNVDLSTRRAEAVKTVLSTQFGIDASRLSAAGVGSAKPIESNDTPQGRAQNRRVEFVRQ